MDFTAHHPRAEADAVLGPAYSARVLEPSPPTITTPDHYADDPAEVGDRDGRPVVTPTSAGDLTWDDILRDRPELGEWAAARWLAARPALPVLPDGYARARDGYHRLAYALVAEARRRANTKFGLRFTRGGFGTPFFGDDEQVRVEHGHLVHQRGDSVEVAEITTLRAASDFLGVAPATHAAEHDSPTLGDLDAPLHTDPATGEFLAAWFGMAWAALEEVRLTDGAVQVERTQLWPGHFDPAIAMGDADAGRRATYGASPGDADHPEPYLYIGPWSAVDGADPFWNESVFPGASMPLRDLAAGADPVADAVGFFREGHRRLSV